MKKPIWRALLALVAAVAVAGVVISHTQHRHLYPLVTVVQAVPLGGQISAADLGTVLVTAVPQGAITSSMSAVGRYAQEPLAPGSTLATAEVGPPLRAGRGEVRVVVSVTPSSSALATTGETVSVYGVVPGPNGALPTVTLLAPAARVIGVYTSGAVPITTLAPGAPALVALAVTPAEATAILPYMTQSQAVVLVALP